MKKDINIWRNNLTNFADLAMRFSEGFKLTSKWHIGYLCEILTAVKNREIRNINIVIPPGHTKTFLTIRAFVPWLLGHDNNARCMYVRRTVKAATIEVTKTRDFMLSNTYNLIFPEVNLNDKGKERFTLLNKRGCVDAKGVEGAITGDNADLLICDDIIAAHDGHTVVDGIYEAIRTGFFTRLRDNEKLSNYGYIFVNQRLHSRDQTAFLQENYNFHNFIIPFIEEEVKTYSFGNFTYTRPIGELLNPQITTVEKLKEKIGDWDRVPSVMSLFQTQYQQNPTEAGERIVKIQDYHYYNTTDLDNYIFDFISISVDTAMTSNINSDYTAMLCFGVRKKIHYLLECNKVRYTYNDMEEEFAKFYAMCQRKYKQIDFTMIEATSNGYALISRLMSGAVINPNNNKPIYPYVKETQPTTNKENRLIKASGHLNNDRFKIPKDANWVAEYVYELENFPNLKHDDCVDATSQYIIQIQEIIDGRGS